MISCARVLLLVFRLGVASHVVRWYHLHRVHRVLWSDNHDRVLRSWVCLTTSILG